MASIDGIYAAYLTGSLGSGVALLLFRKGALVGTDMGGVKYDGSIKEQDGTYPFEIVVTLPANAPLVQGVTTGVNVTSYPLSGVLPSDFLAKPFVRINGHNGPVNARFVKLRALIG